MQLRMLTRCLFVIWLCLAVFPLNAATNWRHAETLINQGDAAAAYQLLLPLESELAGNVAYDALLAKSAHRSGNYTEAIFAYERLLATMPNHQEARLQLANIYYRLGETASASAAYQRLLDSNPSAAIQSSAKQQMTAIQDGLRFHTTQASGYLGIKFGYDTNVNSATDETELVLPDHGSGTTTSNLAGAFREQSDIFASLFGGVNVDHQLSRGISIYGKGRISKRRNRDERDFDNGQVALDIGLKFDHQSDQYRLGYYASEYRLDGDGLRNTNGVTAVWHHALNLIQAIKVSGFHGRVKYDGQSIRNVDRSVATASYTHLFNSSLSPRLQMSLYGGEEDSRSGTSHLGHDLVGGRLLLELSLYGPRRAYGLVGYEKRDYGGQDPLFLKSREDRQASIAVGLKYQPAPKWELVPELRYMKNNSNLDANEYDRIRASVVLLRRF